jgi:hypothetical protein
MLKREFVALLAALVCLGTAAAGPPPEPPRRTPRNRCAYDLVLQGFPGGVIKVFAGGLGAQPGDNRAYGRGPSADGVCGPALGNQCRRCCGVAV